MNTPESTDERIRRFLIALAQHPEAEKRMKRYPRPAALSGFAEIALAVGRELGIGAEITWEELTRTLQKEEAARRARVREAAELRPLPDGDLQSVSGGRETVLDGLQSAMERLLRWHTEASAQPMIPTHGTTCDVYTDNT